VNFLLDTNVISETTKRLPAPAVLEWVAGQPVDTLYTASLAIAEIRAGIGRVVDPAARRSDLVRWLEQKVRPFFAARIIEPDEACWMAMLAVLDRAKARRRTLPVSDLIFAATAERHDMVVVTRNVKDFGGAGVRILDPWKNMPAVTVCD
jgi:predicted nucleic acid-binding protein